MNAELIEIDEDEYENNLNELYEPVQIGGLTFEAGRIVRELDPVAFRCMISEEQEQWKCGECDTIYESEEDAEECCKEDEDT